MKEKMTAKEIRNTAASHLSRYRMAKNDAKDIERRIKRVRSEMMSVKGISYEDGDMPHAQFRTGDLSDYAARIDDLLQDWKAAQICALDIMREVSASINKIENASARRVLMLHFVDGYTFEEISRIMHCGADSVYRWRRIGLFDLGMKLNSKS